MDHHTLPAWPFVIGKSNSSKGYRLIAAPDFMIQNGSASRLTGQTSGQSESDKTVFVRVLYDDQLDNPVTVVYRKRYPTDESGKPLLSNGGRAFVVTEGAVFQGNILNEETSHLSMEEIFNHTDRVFSQFFESEQGKAPVLATDPVPVAYTASAMELIEQPSATPGEYGITPEPSRDEIEVSTPLSQDGPEDKENILNKFQDLVSYVIESGLQILETGFGKHVTQQNPDEEEARSNDNLHSFKGIKQVTTASVGAVCLIGSLAALNQERNSIWQQIAFGLGSIAGAGMLALAISKSLQTFVLEHLPQNISTLLHKQIHQEQNAADSVTTEREK